METSSFLVYLNFSLVLLNWAWVVVKGHKFYIFMQPKGLENQKDG